MVLSAENRSATATRTRIGGIDGLRGIAILGVLLVHCSAVLSGSTISIGPIDLTRLLVYPGRYGVELFFILSGLTLTLSLERRRGHEEGLFRNYFVRRFFRLSPMYYGVLAWTAAASYNNVLETGTINPPGNVINYVLHIMYIHGLFPAYVRSILGPAWSLTPEIVFYLSLPVILIACNTTRKRIALFLSALAFANLFFRAAILPHSQTNAIWTEISPPVVYFLFLAGVLLADVYRRYADQRVTEPNRRLQFADVSLLIAISGFFGSYYFGVLMPFLPWVMMALGVSAYCLGSTALEAILSFLPLRLLGTISYSVFLTHYPVVEYLVPVFARYAGGLPPWLLFTVFFASVVVIIAPLSLVTYRFVERPGIALGDYVIRSYMRRRDILSRRHQNGVRLSSSG